MNFNDLTVKLHLPGDSERDCGAVVLSKRPAADNSNRDSQVSDKSLSCAPAVSALEKATTTLEHGSGCFELMAAEIPEKEQKDEEINKIERTMPATGIGWRTTNILSQYLRPPRPGSCDWRDMAEEMGFSYQLHIQNFALESDPVAKVLSAWCTKPGSNVGKLLDIIEKIERHDVLHELPAFLGEKMEK